jgi:hypothetical protein
MDVPEITRLRRIVRDLAEADPIAAIGRDCDEYVCLLCPDGWDDDEYRASAETVVHHEACPWVLAKAEQ